MIVYFLGMRNTWPTTRLSGLGITLFAIISLAETLYFFASWSSSSPRWTVYSMNSPASAGVVVGTLVGAMVGTVVAGGALLGFGVAIADGARVAAAAVAGTRVGACARVPVVGTGAGLSVLGVGCA